MTRVLSELLGAREPLFSSRLRQLEAMAGHPNADIRLANEIQLGLRAKLRELGLDSGDTTGPELYAALGERLKADELLFKAAIRQVSGAQNADSDLLKLLAQALQAQIQPATCFALKPAAARRILRANLPKKAMKALGYRSADSMLRHEAAAHLYAAGWLLESREWSRRLLSALAKLEANDFEIQPVRLTYPTAERWQALAEQAVAAKKHSVLAFRELGVVVLLPVPAMRPPLNTLTTAVLALLAVNEIRAAGSYLLLHQMRPDFGAAVRLVAAGEPVLSTSVLDWPVPWRNLYQGLARLWPLYNAEHFEPLLSTESIGWTPVEDSLAALAPALGFWKQTPHLGLLDAGKPVSCNLADSLLSHCNVLPFEQRVFHHFRDALRSELLLRYFSRDKLEQIIFGGFGALPGELALEAAAA